jgi:uncharacterized membrane protein
MSDPATSLTTPADAAEAKSANIIYVLYLVSFVLGITLLVGLVMAYVNKGTAPDWVQTHYRYQIRTFWIGLLYAAIGAITLIVGVGLVILLFLAIWFVVRCARGMQHVAMRAPMPKPATWLW